MNKAKAWHFFLTSRPYSYADNAARALLVCGQAGAAQDSATLWRASLVSLLMWLHLNWYSDRRQRQAGRLLPSARMVWLPVALSAVLIIPCGFTAYIGLGLYLLSIRLYPCKAVYPALGIYGPLFRGLTVGAHVLFVLSLVPGPHPLTPEFVFLALALSLLQAARNLVGDIRDIGQDRFELPARFGFRAAMRVTYCLLATGLLAGGMLSQGRLALIIPMLILCAALELSSRKWGTSRPGRAGYVAHRLFVFAFTMGQALMAIHFGVSSLLCYGLIAVSALANLTYPYLPGKRFAVL